MKIHLNKLLENSSLIKVVSYPEYDLTYAREIVEQLKELSVTFIIFEGEKKVGNISVLGKGTTSIVLKGVKDDKTVAIKVLRKDANRPSVIDEAKRLELANKVGVGPKLIGYRDKVLVMEYVEGKGIVEGLKGLLDQHQIPEIKRIIKDLLTQCYNLDRLGLDHGELSYADKHVIITRNMRPVIIDFESASTTRKTANLTSIIQYIFYRLPYSEHIRQIFGITDLNALYSLLRRYKREKSDDIFKSILEFLGLR